MNSQFHLSLVILTIATASDRVIPELISKFSFMYLYDTVVALNPVVTAFWLTGFLISLQICLSIITRSYAWNDRFWTFIPLLYGVLYTLHPFLSQDRRTNASLDLRLTVMCSLVLMWSLRLTYGSICRGYYKPGTLDHRYPWLRANIVKNAALFAIAYAILVCGMMTVLLALASSPFYFAWVGRGLNPKFTFLDGIASIGMFFGIVLEAIADFQQQRFQTLKASWLKRSHSQSGIENDLSADEVADLKNGFLQSGLFAWSRHPNFFAEMMVWCSFYLFSVSPSALWVNWTVMGAIMYIVLFQITTLLTETISREKYPSYSDYCKRVSRLIPSPLSRRAAPVVKGSKED